MAHKWYFVRCQSGREKRIRDNALHRLKIAGVTEVIPQVLVPFELVTDMKGGKKKTVEKKLYPGYLMVQADLDEADDPSVIKARTTLRGIDGLRDFLGARGEPTALSEEEVTAILSRMTD
ncbi:MAG: transcriptional antiterminator NusG, partial [Planctomycetota bacterium]